MNKYDYGQSDNIQHNLLQYLAHYSLTFKFKYIEQKHHYYFFNLYAINHIITR
jgi:hypothetical protein